MDELALLSPIDLGERETVSMVIARRLMAYLLTGSIVPGQRLPSERQMAEALGVGRSNVREALKFLTFLGMVDVRQGDGTYLKRLESDLLPRSIEWGLMLGTKRALDLVEARRYLEIIIAGLAAERRDESELAELAESLEAMTHARPDSEAFVDADVAFHLGVSRAARNQSLTQIMASIRALLTVWITRVMQSPGAFAPSVDEHREIFLAIANRDPEEAKRAMSVHMDRATARLEAAIEADRERRPSDADARVASVARSLAALKSSPG